MWIPEPHALNILLLIGFLVLKFNLDSGVRMLLMIMTLMHSSCNSPDCYSSIFKSLNNSISNELFIFLESFSPITCSTNNLLKYILKHVVANIHSGIQVARHPLLWNHYECEMLWSYGLPFRLDRCSCFLMGCFSVHPGQMKNEHTILHGLPSAKN